MAKKSSKSKLVKSIKKLTKSIKKGNKKFKAATAAQKRVLIAKDVIASLGKRKIRPACGTWLSTSASKMLIYIAPALVTAKDLIEERQLSDILAELPTCRACAIGTMFNVSVQRFNKLKCTDLTRIGSITIDELKEEITNGSAEEADSMGTEIESEDAFNFLGRFFTDYQLARIEAAFEMGYGLHACNDSDLSQQDFWDSVLFGMRFRTARGRMGAIMENIVKNKGLFEPKKVKHKFDTEDYETDLLTRRSAFVERAGVESNYESRQA